MGFRNSFKGFNFIFTQSDPLLFIPFVSVLLVMYNKLSYDSLPNLRQPFHQ